MQDERGRVQPGEVRAIVSEERLTSEVLVAGSALAVAELGLLLARGTFDESVQAAFDEDGF